MSTIDIALSTAKIKNLPYWKLYKGTDRVSQCDKEENPTGSPEEAYRQLVEEINQRPAGTYKLNVYRVSKGDKSGFKYDFVIPDSHQNSINRPMSYGHSPEQIYAQAERDIKILNLLEQLNKKVDAIGEFIISRNDDDDSNDGDVFKKMTSVFGLINQMKGMGAATTAAGTSATTAAASGAANGFRGLR
jgi:hypothetical protein